MTEKERKMDDEDEKHVLEHRCLMLTKPPWDGCKEESCPGDLEKGTNTWLKMVDDPKYESLCWECPVLKKMYPNVRNCDYFEKKYGE